MKKQRNRKPRSKNVGTLDALLRVTLGSIVLIVGNVFENWWGLLGLVLIITGSISWCPAYRIFGIRTCKPDIELEV